jgi:hypothetical protein
VVVEVPSAFAEAIPLLSTTSHPTLNEAVPVYNCVFNDIEDFLGRCNGNDLPSGRERAAAINACSPANRNTLRRALEAAHAKLRTYHGLIRAAMYDIALILDPRLRAAYFRANGWERQFVAGAKNAVLRAMRACGTEPPPPDSTDIEARLGRMRGQTFVGLKEAQAQEESKLSHCLSHCLAGSAADANTDLLKWWEQHASMYSRLARIARDYLAIPATSAPADAEPVFSGASNLITKKRGSLSEDVIRVCVSLNSWLRE